MTPKNHTISKIIAKACLRVLVLLLAFSLYFFFTGDFKQTQSLYFENKSAVIFPILLFFTVITLMVLVLKNKFSKIDFNWFFALSALFLIVYIVLLYTRMYPLL